VVLDGEAAAEVSENARHTVALAALAAPDSEVGRAYAHFSVQLDFHSSERMFADFEARRGPIGAYLGAVASDGVEADVCRRCGVARLPDADAVRERALARALQTRWRRGASGLLATGMITDATLARRLLAVGEAGDFDELRDIFLNPKNEPRLRLGTSKVDAATKAWLGEEQARLVATWKELATAQVIVDTLHALALARAYIELYEGEKSRRGALDFGDLVDRAVDLLTRRADAAWVLYKLDGGIEHILVDEAQDTAPEQWDIVRALAEEFFTGPGGRGVGRSVFAVADVKQSIFSFQGAAPERFGEEQAAFSAMIDGSGARFLANAMLRQSRRSRPEILTFVDTVFADPAALAGLAPAGAEPMAVRHEAERGGGGAVDLWPLEIGQTPPDPDPWLPGDEALAESASRRLARRIALTINAMVAAGEGVGERTSEAMRRCRYGDFLILVRRRNALFHDIIRALRREGAPVGGADRLLLSSHGLFADLMALARFARFPADDLSLAGLLRSPFCDLGEDDLFDLAHDRAGSLWAELNRRAGERACWASALPLLAWAIAHSAALAPFDFFNRVLGRLDAEGRSMRQRLLSRLGAEAQDALESFLTEAADAESRGVRDLETFIVRLGSTDLEVKREQEEGQSGALGEVRVMTVHGAKGLEAPIVILPDTSTRATPQGGPLMATGDGGFVWAPRTPDDCAFSAAAREARERAVEHESARLLYVALTRARDRLILCGVETRSLFERSWYDFVARAFDKLESHPVAMVGGGAARRFGADPVLAAETQGAAPDQVEPPAWALRLAPVEDAFGAWRSPSSLGETVGLPAPSPLDTVNGLGRYRRGEIIHRLLQLLPDIAPAGREAACARLLEAERDLSADQRSEMAAAALTVLADPAFAAVFGPGSRAEVALAGSAPSLPRGPVSGRLDRLLVTSDKVLVVDFKTNRPPPRTIEACDRVYITQMAVYAAVLAEIFPGRPVEAALLWTDGPTLMPVPEEMMRDALRGLAADSAGSAAPRLDQPVS
jgi:ATP-dependent helicase/nuclease subunit A